MPCECWPLLPVGPHYPDGETEAHADSVMCPRSPTLKVAALGRQPSCAHLEACSPHRCDVPITPLRETAPPFPARRQSPREQVRDSKPQSCVQAGHRFGSRARRLASHCTTPSTPGCHPRQERAAWGGARSCLSLATCQYRRDGPFKMAQGDLLLPCSLRSGNQMR